LVPKILSAVVHPRQGNGNRLAQPREEDVRAASIRGDSLTMEVVQSLGIGQPGFQVMSMALLIVYFIFFR
jgi:hypothetical protein